MNDFIHHWTLVQTAAHANAVSKGWWEADLNIGEKIALMHSELSEALEAARHGNPSDSHCPEFSSLEVEFADVIIRIMDLAGHMNLRVGEAIVAKMAYNANRPHKHGGKAF